MQRILMDIKKIDVAHFKPKTEWEDSNYNNCSETTHKKHDSNAMMLVFDLS